jgi:hypothetical protein
VDFAIVGKLAQTVFPDGDVICHLKPAFFLDTKVVIGDVFPS